MAASHEAAAKAEALKAQADNVEAQKKKMEMERRQSKADLKMKALEEAMKIMSGQQTERSSRVVKKSGVPHAYLGSEAGSCCGAYRT